LRGKDRGFHLSFWPRAVPFRSVLMRNFWAGGLHMKSTKQFAILSM
jgi:hypothetical protein